MQNKNNEKKEKTENLEEKLKSFSLSIISEKEDSNLEITKEEIKEIIESQEIKIEEFGEKENISHKVEIDEKEIEEFVRENFSSKENLSNSFLHEKDITEKEITEKEINLKKEESIFLENLNDIFSDDREISQENDFCKEINKGLSIDLIELNRRVIETEKFMGGKIKFMQKEIIELKNLREFDLTKIKNLKELLNKKDEQLKFAEKELKKKSGEIFEICEFLKIFI